MSKFLSYFILSSDALSTALSALYAKVIVILGIALPVTEILSSQIPANVYQGFYLYLYITSILFVIFVYASNMRRRAVMTLIKNYRMLKKQFTDVVCENNVSFNHYR